MNEALIRGRLVDRGNELFAKSKEKMIAFTRDQNADALLNDLAGHPHAFVLACLMDRQIKAEKAWLIPHRISEKLGGFSMTALAKLTPKDVRRLMSKPAPLHRFVDKMSRLFHAGVQRIADKYSGDASRMWANKPTSAEVVYRFLEFDGAGPKIATMAANILARDFKIPFADYFSIDISADIHIRRVFGRLGLCDPDATVEQIVYKARGLHPTFPGVMDFPCWEVGRTWCKVRDPECANCYMSNLCPTAARLGGDDLHRYAPAAGLSP